MGKTRDASSVTTVGSLVNISTPIIVRKMSNHFLTAVHTTIKPSSRVASVIPTSNKEVPSSVNHLSYDGYWNQTGSYLMMCLVEKESSIMPLSVLNAYLHTS